MALKFVGEEALAQLIELTQDGLDKKLNSADLKEMTEEEILALLAGIDGEMLESVLLNYYTKTEVNEIVESLRSDGSYEFEEVTGEELAKLWLM